MKHSRQLRTRRPKLQGFWPARFLCLFLWISCPGVNGADLAAAKTLPEQFEFFETKVRPILVSECCRCHSDKAEKLDCAELKAELERLKKSAQPNFSKGHMLTDTGSSDMAVAIRGDLRKPGEPAPRSTSESRPVITVPHQYLLAPNSALMTSRAKARGGRLQRGTTEDRARIESAYPLPYSRPPAASETKLGLADLADTAAGEAGSRWTSNAQALLSAHEFRQIQ